MIDLGLTTGIKDLWQENLLRDYTLVVEGQEFQVHKVVLAAVSKYFKAMLGEGFLEFGKDKVEVKGFSADIVSKLLEFLYTADENVIRGEALGIVQCALYLQMPLVVDFCVKKLMEDLKVDNCLDVLTVLKECSFPSETEDVKRFIQTNWETVMKNCSPEEISYEALKVLLEFWERSEWDLFMFIKNWICSDLENHMSCVDDLMSQVRFCLISPEKLQAIREIDIFFNTEGTWQHLVINALKYHQWPINLKVIDKSEQSQVRKEPSPVFVTTPPRERYSYGSDSESDIDADVRSDMFFLDKENKWQKDSRTLRRKGRPYLEVTFCIPVNNFLICYSPTGKHRQWHIFDCRTLTWSEMSHMEKATFGFVMVHHNDHLYTLGGEQRPGHEAGETEIYDFITDKWSPFNATPVSVQSEPVEMAAACVLGDTIYFHGGKILSTKDDMYKDSDMLHSLNLSHRNPIWEKRSSSSCEYFDHSMSVMKRNGEDAIVVINQFPDIECYNPAHDQWSSLHKNVTPHDLVFGAWSSERNYILVEGNTVFILIISAGDLGYYDDDDEYYEYEPPEDDSYPFMKWIIPEYGDEIIDVPVENWERSSHDFTQVMMAIPPPDSKK